MALTHAQGVRVERRRRGLSFRLFFDPMPRNAPDKAMQKMSTRVAICPPTFWGEVSDHAPTECWWDRPDDLCAVRGDGPAQQRLFERLMRTESRFLLDNDLSLIPPLLCHLRDNLVRMNLCDEPGIIRVSSALEEALTKAIVRGNLEIDPCLREADPQTFQTLIEEHQREKPYRDRRVYVVAKEHLHEARYVIRHEGPGFYAANLREADDPQAFGLVSVRSMELIRAFMDEVSHDEAGKEMTLVKRRDL